MLRLAIIVAAAGLLGVAATFGAAAAPVGSGGHFGGARAGHFSSGRVGVGHFNTGRVGVGQSGAGRVFVGPNRSLVRTNRAVLGPNRSVVGPNRIVVGPSHIIRSPRIGVTSVGWRRWHWQGRYWNFNGYLGLAESYCTGYTVDDCYRRWIETEDGFECVKFCPW